MNSSPLRLSQALRSASLILVLCALPALGTLTGCHTGSRTRQSTGEMIDDHSVSSSVRKALADDPRFKFGDVNVATFKGVVQLSGFVGSYDQKTRAAEVASKVDGVKEVQNLISLKE